MKVLVDTSVWINHFRETEPELQRVADRGSLWTHSLVIGELAAGSLSRRSEVLSYLRKLPRATSIDLEEGLFLIDHHALGGIGLCWSDIQLLAAARVGGLQVWTRDRALATAAQKLGVGFPPS